MQRVQQIRGKPVSGRNNVIARIFKGAPKKPHPDPQKAAKGIMIAGDDLTYFRVEFDQQNPSFRPESALECWHDLYGDKPSQLLNVQFATDNPYLALTSVNEQWVTSRKGTPICSLRCDGNEINYQWNGEGGVDRSKKPCQYPACKCAFTYRLTFWLPEFTNRSGIMGEFLLTAHSRNDYENIFPAIDTVAEAEGELLRRVAFTLYRKPQRIVQEDGQPAIKSIVHLNLMEAAAQRFALAAGEAAAALTLPSGFEPHVEPPQDVPQEAPQHVVFQPFVSIRGDSSGMVEYRFMDVQGAIYNSFDTDLVKSVIPNVTALAVDKKHEIHDQLSGVVSGGRVIELRSDPIPF